MSSSLSAAMSIMNLGQPASTTGRTEHGLMKLPGELRNTIFEMVLLHEATRGIIMPLSDDPEVVNAFDANLWDDIDFKKVLSESFAQETALRWRIEDGALVHPDTIHGYTVEENFNRMKAANSDHFCTLRCLAQPALAFVCRDVRKETLGVFYSINQFHIDLGNFSIARSKYVRGERVIIGSGRDNKNFTPVDWFRAIGDTNLRSIKRLTLVAHPYCQMPLETGARIDYFSNRTPRLKLEAAQDSGQSESLHTLDSDAINITKINPKTLSDPGSDPDLKALNESGLHVVGLERLLSKLEPANGEHYLRDETSLEENHYGHLPPPGLPARRGQANPYWMDGWMND